MQQRNNDFYIFLDMDGVMVNGHNTTSFADRGIITPSDPLFSNMKKRLLAMNPLDRFARSQHAYDNDKLVGAAERFNVEAVDNLNSLQNILEKLGHNVRIVMSSTWQARYTPAEMQEILEYAGVNCNNPIDFTWLSSEGEGCPSRRDDDILAKLAGAKMVGKGFDIAKYLITHGIRKDQFCAIDNEVCAIEAALNKSRLGLPYSPIINTSQDPDTFERMDFNPHYSSRHFYLKSGHVRNFAQDLMGMDRTVKSTPRIRPLETDRLML
jgi:hypothetical protein